MDNKKIERGQMLYLVLQKGCYWCDSNAIVPVKVIRRKRGGLFNFVVEQDIEGFKHRLTVSHEWLTVLKPQAAIDLAFNQAQTKKRIIANSWLYNLTRKTAKHEILNRLTTLSKSKRKQAIFWKRVKKIWPEIFKANGQLATSKISMKLWDNLGRGILSLEFPKRDMDKHEGRDATDGTTKNKV
jgi:hypothetical protein